MTLMQTRRMMAPSIQQDEETLLAHSSAVHAFGPLPEAPATGGVLRPASGGRGGSAGRGRWGQRLTLSSQRNPHWGRSTQTLEELPTEKPLEGGSHQSACRLFLLQRLQRFTLMGGLQYQNIGRMVLICVPLVCRSTRMPSQVCHQGRRLWTLKVL